MNCVLKLSCYNVLMCVEVIDAGLRRCGRFDREVAMHVPDEKVCCCRACVRGRLHTCVCMYTCIAIVESSIACAHMCMFACTDRHVWQYCITCVVL